MAEWLGRGLQNLVQRFESASDLKSSKTTDANQSFFCFIGGGVDGICKHIAIQFSAIYNFIF